MPKTNAVLRLVDADQGNGSWQEHDPVFFHKQQISLGTILTFWGRTDHGSLWRVSEIKPFGKLRTRKREEVQKLDDTIVLTRISGNQWTQASFSYLSYSSIWRLAGAS